MNGFVWFRIWYSCEWCQICFRVLLHKLNHCISFTSNSMHIAPKRMNLTHPLGIVHVMIAKPIELETCTKSVFQKTFPWFYSVRSSNIMEGKFPEKMNSSFSFTCLVKNFYHFEISRHYRKMQHFSSCMKKDYFF